MVARKKYVDEKFASEFTGFSRSYLARARWRGNGPPFLKFGTRGHAIRYDLAQLDAWMRSHQAQTDAQLQDEPGSDTYTQYVSDSGFQPVTLERACEDFFRFRDSLKPKTIENYRYRLRFVRDWLELPVSQISMKMIEERHRKISVANSKTLGNDVMRTLRSIIGFAINYYIDENEYPLLNRNPVKRLTAIKAWHPTKTRRDVIHPHQLPEWFRVIGGIEERSRDYFLLLLFTGMRALEASQLKWSQVSIRGRFLMLDETKNGLDHGVPFSDFITDLMADRRSRIDSEWVFPGHVEHQSYPVFQRAAEAASALCGFYFRPHTLRRTFVTMADELELPHGVTKELVNHIQTGDITERYKIRSIERLRRATQQITDLILYYAGIPSIKHLPPPVITVHVDGDGNGDGESPERLV